MQKINFITDYNFEAKSNKDLFKKIEDYCFRNGNFYYKINYLFAITENSIEFDLAEKEIENIQKELDAILEESQRLWQIEYKSIYDYESGETYFIKN